MITTTISGTDALTVEKIKKHLNIDFSDDDTYLEAYLSTSLVACENYCRDNFLERLNVQNIGKFSDGELPLILPTDITYKPNGNVTLRFKVGTVDTTLVIEPLNLYTQEINNYIVIVLAETVTVDASDDVTIEWNTGANTIDKTIEHARLLLCGTYYENRENAVTGVSVNELPNGVVFLLEPYMRPQVG